MTTKQKPTRSPQVAAAADVPSIDRSDPLQRSPKVSDRGESGLGQETAPNQVAMNRNDPLQHSLKVSDRGNHAQQRHPSSSLIEVKALTKVYGKGEIAVHALRGINAVVAEGEFVAVMGPSGSGKSTLMNILGCLDRPTDGTYILDGEDVSKLSKNQLAGVRNRKIGFIFQSYNLLPRLTAVKNVMLPMLYNTENGKSDQEHYDRAIAALESVGLGDRIDHRPNELSGGQQQRVAIARSLVNDPAIILADEPTGNLDTRSAEDIMEILHQLHEERGATIVMVTHELDIAGHAERVIYLRDGQIISDKLHASSIVDLHNGDNGLGQETAPHQRLPKVSDRGVPHQRLPKVSDRGGRTSVGDLVQQEEDGGAASVGDLVQREGGEVL